MAAKKRQKSLSHGRPPISRPKERMTAERSRTIIRNHHRLQKEHAAALKSENIAAANEIALRIQSNGGIKVYQAASKQGQANDRGGDSSRILVEWLRKAELLHTAIQYEEFTFKTLKCLEVGSLSVKNEVSKFPKQIEMTRIDLSSQESGIKKQDFMQRPLPTSEDEFFDIISLSLVLNYVPDVNDRGNMLRRVTEFLRSTHVGSEEPGPILPVLFLVLPLPCVRNSRYLDEALLLRIMESLGFKLAQNKHTSKLCYYLFTWCSNSAFKVTEKKKFRKRKVRDGPSLNNFCIVLD